MRQDPPPPEVVAATKRLDAAQKAGVDPTMPRVVRDARTLWRWLDEQEAKYPSEGR